MLIAMHTWVGPWNHILNGLHSEGPPRVKVRVNQLPSINYVLRQHYSTRKRRYDGSSLSQTQTHMGASWWIAHNG